MRRVILYHAHPGQRFSQVNAAMWTRAATVQGITRVDLYADYPRFDIDIDREQQRLVAHDVIVLQFPLFWYAAPSLLKEWLDLVLEHGFAYGRAGDRLAGKGLQLAVTAAGAQEAYGPGGYNRYPIRDYLRPFEQTARLCGMAFLPPYALFGALQDDAAARDRHVAGYATLLSALRDGRIALTDAAPDALFDPATLKDPA